MNIQTSFQSKRILGSSLVFDPFVHLLCFNCKNYRTKPTCPPNIPKVDYEKILKNPENNLLVVYKIYDITNFNKQQFQEIRVTSTNEIHTELLRLETQLYNSGITFKNSFIGGSCKLCAACSFDICKQPYKSRIPWEATGCNVIKTLQNNQIEISFPTDTKFGRYGLLLWRE